MKNILCSNFESLSNYVKELEKYIDKSAKVVIIPWSFPNELNSLDEYFGVNSKRYNKYLSALKNLG